MKKRPNTKKRENLFAKSFEEVRETLRTATKRELQYELDHCADREWTSEEQRLNSLPKLHLGDPTHALPWTRRDFLAQGLIGAALTWTLPSFLSHRAQAATCPEKNVGRKHLPLLILDAGGGASFMGDNVLVGRRAPTQFIANMTRMGVPHERNPANDPGQVRRLFGSEGKMLFHQHSGLARGMAEAAGSALSFVDGTTICCESDDDTENNPLNISQALVQLGVTGELVNSIGSRNSSFGGNSKGIMPNEAARSTRVRRQEEAARLVSPGFLTSGMNNNGEMSNRVVRAVAALTEIQVQTTTGRALTTKDKEAVACAAQDNIEILAGQDLNNIYNHTQFPYVPAAFPNGPSGEVEEAVATGVWMALTGKAGVSTVHIGGCDYHNQGRAQQDAKDVEVGRACGAAFAMAQAARSPLVVYLFSDGSTSSNQVIDDSTGMFSQVSDNGRYGSLHIFVFDPRGRPQVIRPQLGEVSENGVVPGATPWAGSPSTAAQVALVNYLHLSGRQDQITQLGSLSFKPQDVYAFNSSVVR